MFITGGAGAGKSHIIKTIYQTATKTFRHGPEDPDKPSVLLLAPTGGAAINIGGNTINSCLAISKNMFGEHEGPLSDERKSALRTKLSNLKLLVIDEVSMVSSLMLKYIHERLKEIYSTRDTVWFGGISIVVVGDFYQLPPVKAKPAFSQFKNELFNLSHPWKQFRMVELMKIMHQQGDHSFTEILNRIHLGQLTKDDKEKLCTRIIKKSDDNYPYDALHIWAENEPVDKYNELKLEMIKRPLVTLIAHDEYPAMASQSDVQKALARNRSETGGLDYKIKLKQDARVMLTTNLNIEDHLINGQMGTVSKIKYNDTSQKPQVIYIKFDDESAGLETIRKSGDLYAMENHAVAIVPVVAKIKVKTSRPSSSEIQRTQYPLALAWACTIHKVQGLTLSTVVFSFELYKQKQFNYGQVYVALSRVKSLEQLYIIGEIDPKLIRADPRVHKEIIKT